MMAFFQYSKSVMDRMCTCKSCTFKTNSRKKCISLNHFLNCRCAYACFQSYLSFYALIHQGIKTKFSQCHGSLCCLTSCTGSCSASLACPCLKICCQCISHTSHSKTNRRFGDDICIHQNKIRIRRKKQIFFKNSFFCINNRQSTARGICRCDRRTDKYRCSRIVCNCLRCIKDLSSTNTNGKITLLIFYDLYQTINLTVTAFSVKIIKNHLTGTLSKALFDRFTDSFISAFTDQNQRFFPLFAA